MATAEKQRKRSSTRINPADDREYSLRQRKIHRQAGRDIGPIPAIQNLKRRKSCRLDLKKFCLTYNPSAFYLKFSQMHLDAIGRLEEAVLQGAIYSFAMPRGSGKSLFSKMAALWALSYGHCKYAFLIGATQVKADELMHSIKTWMRWLPAYQADFPEIAHPVGHLEGIATRASSQTCMGHSTMIAWSKSEVILPTVPAPPNLPGFKNGDLAPTSGSMLKACGLTGDGIRGSVHTTTTGQEIRPDIVIADDPQNDASAASAKQNRDRYDLMTGAVLGMAGPDKDLSLVVPCTKIKRGDMVDLILDRTENPLFRGTCYSIIDKMPTNMALWDEYFSVYQHCALREPPDFEEANKFFKKNKKKLIEGCKATWPQRFKETEVHPVQSAMNLYCRDPNIFMAEFMNDPTSDVEDVSFLSATEITKKQHKLVQGKVPLEVEKITAFIDVQQELMFYGIVGWSNNFDGFVIEYGTFPKQKRITFEKRAIPFTLSKSFPDMNENGRLYKALEELVTGYLCTLEFRRKDDNTIMHIDRIGIDSGYKRIVVHRFIRDANDKRLQSCRGGSWGAKKKPMNHPDYTKKWTSGGRTLGPHWRIDTAQAGIRALEHDPNFWKTFIHERLATAIGDDGSLSLFKADPSRHQLIASHLKAEYRTQLTGPYGQIDEWEKRPGKPDNDYFDVLVGCAIMASVEGIRGLGAETEHQKVRPPKADWSQWQKA